MDIMLVFKRTARFIPSWGAFSSQRAPKHFHSKNCILAVCFMGHLLCHRRPTQIISPSYWLTASSIATTAVYTKFVIIKKYLGVCLLKYMDVCTSKHSIMARAS